MVGFGCHVLDFVHNIVVHRLILLGKQLLSCSSVVFYHSDCFCCYFVYLFVVVVVVVVVFLCLWGWGIVSTFYCETTCFLIKYLLAIDQHRLRS